MRLRNDASRRHLPVAWTILYELTKLTNEQFENGIKAGDDDALDLWLKASEPTWRPEGPHVVTGRHNNIGPKPFGSNIPTADYPFSCLI
jgi:hypothetical protein